jgi:hypothetical protein
MMLLYENHIKKALLLVQQESEGDGWLTFFSRNDDKNSIIPSQSLLFACE